MGGAEKPRRYDAGCAQMPDLIIRYCFPALGIGEDERLTLLNHCRGCPDCNAKLTSLNAAVSQLPALGAAISKWPTDDAVRPAG